MEGILLREGKDESLIVSVELLQRSVAIRVNGYDVELAYGPKSHEFVCWLMHLISRVLQKNDIGRIDFAFMNLDPPRILRIRVAG